MKPFKTPKSPRSDLKNHQSEQFSKKISKSKPKYPPNTAISFVRFLFFRIKFINFNYLAIINHININILIKITRKL
jgi:hypothetical protein